MERARRTCNLETGGLEANCSGTPLPSPRDRYGHGKASGGGELGLATGRKLRNSPIRGSPVLPRPGSGRGDKAREGGAKASILRCRIVTLAEIIAAPAGNLLPVTSMSCRLDCNKAF